MSRVSKYTKTSNDRATEKLEDLNLQNLHLVKGPPKESLKGATVIYLNKHGSKQQLYLQIPMMFCWGISKTDDKYKTSSDAVDKYSLSIQFPPKDSFTETDSKLFNKLVELENYIIDQAVSHNTEWFGDSEMDRPVLKQLFGGILKYPKIKGTKMLDKTKAPSFRLKISTYENKFNVSIYDSDKNLLYSPSDPNTAHVDVIQENLIPSKSSVKCLVTASVWIVGGKFYPVLKLQQVICKPPDVSLFNHNVCAFDIDENDIELVNASARMADAEQSDDVAHSNDADDTDDEDIPISIPAPAAKPVVKMPVPVPVPAPVVVEKNPDPEPIPVREPLKVDPVVQPPMEEEEEIIPVPKKTKKTTKTAK